MRLAWSTEQVPGQPALHRQTLSQKQTNQKPPPKTKILTSISIIIKEEVCLPQMVDGLLVVNYEHVTSLFKKKFSYKITVVHFKGYFFCIV